MQTTVIWSHVLGAKVALHIHHRGGLDGRYVVSRLWPDCPDEWNPVALWPVGDEYAGDWPTLRLDAAGEVVVQREPGRVLVLHPMVGVPCEALEIAA